MDDDVNITKAIFTSHEIAGTHIGLGQPGSMLDCSPGPIVLATDTHFQDYALLNKIHRDREQTTTTKTIIVLNTKHTT